MRDALGAELLDVKDALNQQRIYGVVAVMSEYMHSEKNDLLTKCLLSIPATLDFGGVQALMSKEGLLFMVDTTAVPQNLIETLLWVDFLRK